MYPINETCLPSLFVFGYMVFFKYVYCIFSKNRQEPGI